MGRDVIKNEARIKNISRPLIQQQQVLRKRIQNYYVII